jgi:hypothetical protein
MKTITARALRDIFLRLGTAGRGEKYSPNGPRLYALTLNFSKGEEK